MEIAVNLKNPAQLFAAVGIAFLLDTPSRFSIREHEGEPTYSATLVLPDSDLRAILRDLKAAPVAEQSEADGTLYSFDAYSRPLLLTLPGKTIELDWWPERVLEQQMPPQKLGGHHSAFVDVAPTIKHD